VGAGGANSSGERKGAEAVTPKPSFLGWPEGSLPAILDPFLWLVTTDDEVVYGTRAAVTLHTVRVQGIVKGPETVADSGADIGELIGPDRQRLVNGIARAAREAMYRQAEEAIAAAAGAGWVLAGHPHIEMTGTVRRDRDAEVDVPCAQCRIDLRFHVPT
jgi:hypothetical protein